MKETHTLARPLAIEEIWKLLLAEMQEETALTDEEKEKAKQSLREILIAEGKINEQE